MTNHTSAESATTSTTTSDADKAREERNRKQRERRAAKKAADKAAPATPKATPTEKPSETPVDPWKGSTPREVLLAYLKGAVSADVRAAALAFENLADEPAALDTLQRLCSR